MSKRFSDFIRVVRGGILVLQNMQLSTPTTNEILYKHIPKIKKTTTPPPPKLMTELTAKAQQLSPISRERDVPVSRGARLFQMGGLAAGLGIGALSEVVKRAIDPDVSKNRPLLLNKANAERIANTFSKMRGAALKLGQMFSMQDEALLPPDLALVMERVRKSADFMPWSQVATTLEKELGEDWSSKFSSFDKIPIAAASIGQL
eukprot:TRINITY_DN5736_c0_g1_i2.p1 TRINITY_DN5736_c0_g1~~TRINITY_DN5736_c0_g1_i2.p1  ORF type:complete len:220 (-),score=47.17 TRINITY_DN5736_c0_g1_i2:418-1029(-)